MPSKPERNRLRIYRRLQKEGMLSLKDGVYLLPYSDDRYEFFQWLSQEIKTLGGEMQFVRTDKLETIENSGVIGLFQKQAEGSYFDIEERIRVFSIDTQQEYESHQNLKKIIRDFEVLYAIDFFHSSKGERLKKEIQAIQNSLEPTIPESIVYPRSCTDFQGKKWQTRPKPFVDRMACAWLIRKFIDPYAHFIFAVTIDNTDTDTITFDMNHATFTHIGDLCTFEVLIRAFSIQDEKIDQIGKIIHNLDINDDKYVVPEADGIRMILSAIRQQAHSDEEILTQSDMIFDSLYCLKEG
jgi:hypothetical protein